MKLFKKAIAAGAALMMTVTGMAINANALTTKIDNVYYTVVDNGYWVFNDLVDNDNIRIWSSGDLKHNSSTVLKATANTTKDANTGSVSTTVNAYYLQNNVIRSKGNGNGGQHGSPVTVTLNLPRTNYKYTLVRHWSLGHNVRNYYIQNG